MRVMVYWNTHKCVWSLMDPRTRRVVEHRQEVHLVNATTKVSEAGRQRVIRTGVKVVHAFVVGDVVDTPHAELPRQLRYNPAETEGFIDRHTKERVDASPRVTLHPNKTVTYE